MKIKFSELKRDYKLEYEFEGEAITCQYIDDEQTITDTFDFSNFAEGDELAKINSDIPVKIVKSVERVDGELKVKLFKSYNLNKKERIEKYGYGNLPFSTEWQVV